MMKTLFTLIFLFSAVVSNAQTVSISSSAAPSNTICAGTNVTFTAHISGFTNPSYKWYVNGTEISGAISSTYSSTSLTNGAQVYVKVTEGTVSDGAIVTDGLRFNLDAGNSASYAGTGPTWTDLSGNGNHGTLAGATLPTYSSDNGGCFVFNGSTSNVNLTKNASAIGIYDNSYTADAWVYPTDLGGDRGMFGDEAAAVRKGLHLTFRGGTIHQGHYSSDANIGSVTINSWYHIVFTFDKATGATRMYKNGVDLGNSGTIQSYIGESNIHLGQAYNNTGFFHGKGAVYKMYNRVLSSAEVTTNYNALKNRFSSSGVNSSSITTTVNAGPAIPVITVSGDACVNKTTLSTPAGFTYAWYKDNVLISSSNVRTYSPIIAGDYKVQVTSGSCSTQSTATTIATCGVTADGGMRAITSPTTLVSHEGGVNFGTGVSELGTTVNATGISTTLGTIGATTAVVSGVISSTNARTTSIGVIYSTDSNFGTYSTSSTQSNVVAGTHAISLSGLTASTTYHAKAFITNKAGTSYGPAVSFTTTTPPIEVGNSYGGGLVFYIFQSGDPGYVAGETHGLIASSSDLSTYTDWKNNGGFTDIATGTGIGTGLANTNAIISSHGSSATYAAGFARAYNGGGYTDWYLPSRDELYKMHISIGQGANNIANMRSETYWSSSQSDSYQAYYMFAQNGSITTIWKDWGKAVRAIRTF
jgi:hypothetical protein